MKLDSVKDLINKFEKIGQGHVFNQFNDLPYEEKSKFLKQAELVDLKLIQNLIRKTKSHIHLKKQNALFNLSAVKPLLKSSIYENTKNQKQILLNGEHAIRNGRVCALVVAGGEGTRLGFHGPKGMLPVTPIKKKSLFQIFAEQIKIAQNRYETVIPWFIMTSDSNHDKTKEFFFENNNFDLTELHFFKQSLCPIIDFEGKLVLDEKGLIALAPDGHGGCLDALNNNGLLDKMKNSGIDIISYFHVDNPLVQCIDPLFIGLHIVSESEMSCKVIKKREINEKVGLFYKEENAIKVIEYTHVPKEMLEMKDEQGEMVFNSGNAGIHLLSREFVKKMNALEKIDFHLTKKKFPQKGIIPEEDNVYKFEKLIFDALPEAQNVVLLEILREEEFSPIKNAHGMDSLETFKKTQLHQFKKWFKKVGVDIFCDESGVPIFNIEISPFFADNQCSFIEKWESLLEKPTISAEIYLE